MVQLLTVNSDPSHPVRADFGNQSVRRVLPPPAIWHIYLTRATKLEGRGKKSRKTHSYAKSSFVLGKFEQLILSSAFRPGLYDRMYSFCSPEVAFCVNFIPSMCRDLRTFHGVKFGSADLLRVKDLTHRNSAIYKDF